MSLPNLSRWELFPLPTPIGPISPENFLLVLILCIQSFTFYCHDQIENTFSSQKLLQASEFPSRQDALMSWLINHAFINLAKLSAGFFKIFQKASRSVENFESLLFPSVIFLKTICASCFYLLLKIFCWKC